MKRFIFKKLKQIDSKEQYQVKISNRFAAVENLMKWILLELGKLLERISALQRK
jgi:hypothetical protein